MPSRYRDDKDLDALLRSQDRAGDPMAHLIKVRARVADKSIKKMMTEFQSRRIDAFDEEKNQNFYIGYYS
jgi:hypothetical protein